jgi:hypothetical protein
MAGSSPGTFPQVCIGFADILASLSEKTSAESCEATFLVQGFCLSSIPD